MSLVFLSTFVSSAPIPQVNPNRDARIGEIIGGVLGGTAGGAAGAFAASVPGAIIGGAAGAAAGAGIGFEIGHALDERRIRREKAKLAKASGIPEVDLSETDMPPVKFMPVVPLLSDSQSFLAVPVGVYVPVPVNTYSSAYAQPVAISGY